MIAAISARPAGGLLIALVLAGCGAAWSWAQWRTVDKANECADVVNDGRAGPRLSGRIGQDFYVEPDATFRYRFANPELTAAW